MPTRTPSSDNPYLASYRNPVLQEVEAFLSATGMTPARFGMEALGDPRVVSDMRKGRDPRSKTVAMLRQFIARETANA
ncbi:hypothetical protein [Sphingomonas sp. Leaf10]|uniref:hypothetical protein n=1 Tax=Sphingomonas sp. Leaf10 TaxID=1735676 RepID=UPI0006FD51B6|nr:hypothetical protein [Sphingomonas sp. Leaf10]KQM33090.1 hypothetical protein ASE59_18140 [Sphingomonas sp. Leaf10]